MTEQQLKEIKEIINNIEYGNIQIKKQAGKIVNIKATKSIKI